MKNILKFGWPVILSVVLLLLMGMVGLTKEFWETLTATLIGVFLAFWLNYLFILFSERSIKSRKLRILLLLLRNELDGNQDDIDWLKQSITSAIKDHLLNDPVCTKSISELLSNLSDRSFYSIQSAGWFDIFENEKLFSDISSIYLDINRLKSIIRFAQAGHEKMLENESDKAAQQAQYEGVSAACDVIRDKIKVVNSSLDEKILNLKTIKKKI